MNESPYLLLTPGPLTTSATVRDSMLKDWCTWDTEYNQLVQTIRTELLDLESLDHSQYTSVLMQGSGSFVVESVIGSVIADNGKLLVVANGAYGDRIASIADRLRIKNQCLNFGDQGEIDLHSVETALADDKEITHVAVVHCETTTGRLNPIAQLGRLVKAAGKIFIVDAMSSFGGIPIDIPGIGIDFLISSANKCIQGVPGFGFVIAVRERLSECRGMARSLALDLFDQWETMEKYNGKWRFTSPTHVVHAFYQALQELKAEGGIEARYNRYRENQASLASGMKELGFLRLIDENQQSPIITTFHYPETEAFSFSTFYNKLKEQGFVIYPGKISAADCFRIGNIGEVYRGDIERLLVAIEKAMYWNKQIV